jgi:RNA polymerase sigma-70 factor (ECF subfamily)
VSASSQEALWVLRAQCGDREALELLLRHVRPSLRSYIRSVVGPSDVDDVLQEVLLLVYRNLKWLRAPEAFRAWALRIASRVAFLHVKKRQGRSEHVEERSDWLDDAAAKPMPDANDLNELLTTNQISPACSAVLALHFQEGMSLAEVAAVLALPLGTVKSRLAYGLAKLRQRLGERRNG